jgi:hypothetical protein
MAKPIFAKMWATFPDHVKYPTLKDLYTALGGKAALNINAPGFGPNGNACASRISVALNKSGAPIRVTSGISTIGTADKSRIIYRVTDLRKYLVATLGKADIDTTIPFDDAFAGKKGIIAFTVSGWGDASGHIALYDGAKYREPSYDNYASYSTAAGAKTVKAEFWTLP